MDKVLVLTSAMGAFVFHRDVCLSHAKLIRDTVTAQWVNAAPGTKKLRTDKDCYVFVENDCSQVISDIPFSLEIRYER